MYFSGKKIAVIGSQKSGQAAAKLLYELGAELRISDLNQVKHQDEIFLNWLEQKGVRYEFGQNTEAFLRPSDLLVVSPGVPLASDPIQWAKDWGVPVIGEIELASWFCPCPIIAVTGSNGKTTVSTLIARVLAEAGKAVELCGNIGNSFSAHVLQLQDRDFVVLEVSSFQMETIEFFKPFIAVLLNISQNHLDRHKDLNDYILMKKKIFMNQERSDYAVLNAQDDFVKEVGQDARATVRYFNTHDQLKAGARNPNHLAVEVVADILRIDAKICSSVFCSFSGVEHRMEKVRVVGGVEFINDSKATTAEAGRWALNNIENPIIMICGGRDKNIDFSVLTEKVKTKVKKMIVLGEAKNKIREVFGGVTLVEEAHDLSAAVDQAYRSAQKGDCVLLSPMCASFDMFKNFEERGTVFKALVSALEE